MRKSILLSLIFTMSAALPALAIEKHQSYVSYDDGGTVVRQADDGREIEARVNLPIFPGDEVVTSRRGRAEIRLSDGNVLGVDRATAVQLQSILDSYEGEDSQTVVELRYGKIGVHRTDIARDLVRLDTRNASYVAQREAVYFIESDPKGADRVVVFDGAIEVRTPTRTTRLRAGESAALDSRGVYDVVSVGYGGDDFERWFSRRSDKRGSTSSRYLDRRLSYYGDDLDSHGRWVMVSGIGWSWRPYVSVGWRPYHNGYWHRGRGGYLTWVSYEPWGWMPYHYGRWAFDGGYGWVWVPGGGYSPAWVYWMYQPGFIGWAPAGYWDCYRGYSNWAYQPYQRVSASFGVGFYGRIRVNEMDLRPWTFIDSNTIVSTRVDRAALTVDAVKQRLGRSGTGFATVSSEPARFTNEQFRDPAGAVKAIARRGVGDPSTARGAAAPALDMTPFFRRDPEVAGAVRDRIIRSRGGEAPSGSSVVVRGGGSASTPSTDAGLAPIGRGSVAPIGRGSAAPIGGGSLAPVGGATATQPSREGAITRPADGWRTPSTPTQQPERGGAIRRRGDDPQKPAEAVGRGTVAGPVDSGRTEAIQRDRGATPSVPRAATPGDSWRSRPSTTPSGSDVSAPDRAPSGRTSREPSASDVPRRVIDRIGGARVVPRDDSGSSSRSGSGKVATPRSERPSRVERPSRPSGGSSSGASSGSSSSSSGSSAPKASSGGESRSSSPSGNRSEGGAIRRDQ